MKKTVVYLGVALVAFANVSVASSFTDQTGKKKEITVYEGISPLNNAIVNGDIEGVKKIISYGADVNEKSNGMSPLMIAARYNKLEIIKILLSNGAKLKAKDGKGFTALKYAELSNAKEVAQFLKQA